MENEVQETPAISDNLIQENQESSNEESSSSEYSNEESWAYRAGKAIGLKSKPPLINLEAIGKPKENKYKTKDEEATADFSEARHWIGIIMENSNFTKFVWCDNRQESLQSILFADMYDCHQGKSIKFKVERNMRVNSSQIDISQYYIT